MLKVRERAKIPYGMSLLALPMDQNRAGYPRNHHMGSGYRHSSLVPSPKLMCSSESAQDPVCSEKFLDDSEEQPGLTTVKEVFEDSRCFSPER